MPHTESHTHAGPAQLFPHLTEAQVYALRIGTPSYQAIHPYNRDLSLSKAHYKSLVQPSMRKPSKSIAHHLGMPVLYGGRNGGTI